VVWTPVFLISYLVTLLLFEATYVYEIFNTTFMTWNF